MAAQQAAVAVAQHEFGGLARGKTVRIAGSESGRHEQAVGAFDKVVEAEELRKAAAAAIAGIARHLRRRHAGTGGGRRQHQFAAGKARGGGAAKPCVDRRDCIVDRCRRAQRGKIEAGAGEQRAIGADDGKNRRARKAEPVAADQPGRAAGELLRRRHRRSGVRCGIDGLGDAGEQRAELFRKHRQDMVAQIEQGADASTDHGGIELLTGRGARTAVGIGKADVDPGIDRLGRAGAAGRIT